MARYKPHDLNQDKFIPVSFRDQILPGSFEYALNEIVDQHIDLAPFAARYTNDETGRLAYDPAVLLKIVLYGYDKGIVSSRRLAEACERHVVFMALSADTRPRANPVQSIKSSAHRPAAASLPGQAADTPVRMPKNKAPRWGALWLQRAAAVLLLRGFRRGHRPPT